MTLPEVTAGAAWFALYATTVFFVVRYSHDRSPAVVAVSLAVVYAMVGLPAAAALPTDGNAWRALLTFCFFTTCYLMIFGAIYKSVSLRILIDLLGSPSWELPAAQVLIEYVKGESFETRTRVMIGQGLAVLEPDGFELTAKGRRVAQCARVLQALFGIQASG